MAKRNIIVIGGSTGSFDVFKKIAAGMPENFDGSIFIVWHMSPDVTSILPQVLNKIGPLFASEAREGERIESGRIYIARPDHHLLLDDGHVRVTRGPKENRFRPAVDPLFRSAAYNYRARVIGVVCSGGLDDGTSGLWTIKQSGGIAIVQEPAEAEISSMPDSAIREVNIDHVVPSLEIARLLTQLSSEEVSPEQEAMMSGNQTDKQTRLEIAIAAEENSLDAGITQWGELTRFTCPECHGVLSQVKDNGRARYRCHTGHAFSPDSLLSSLTESIEDSLWTAIRGVEESVFLLNHIGDHFAENNRTAVAAKFFQKAIEARKRNEQIRNIVFDHERLSTEFIANELALPPEDVGAGDSAVG